MEAPEYALKARKWPVAASQTVTKLSWARIADSVARLLRAHVLLLAGKE